MTPLRINPLSETPKGLRLHIGLFGKRNAGKSSLMNALVHQNISIVSDVAGTTTDSVEKAAELSPLGPVVFIDTAGLDDTGLLGEKRAARSRLLFPWMDLTLIVTTADSFGKTEESLIQQAKEQKLPCILVLNKTDETQVSESFQKELSALLIPYVLVSAKTGFGIDSLRSLMISVLSEQREPEPEFLAELVHSGDTVFLVVPIDTGAPKGRLILPQVQAIRAILDKDAKCLVVRENELVQALSETQKNPSFVITDSQIVRKVVSAVPPSIPVTTFSIEMSAMKSDLISLARGTAHLNFLKNGDKILICETCSHHPQPDDIGRKKIPRWLTEKTGASLTTDISVGKDFPEDISPYSIIIQCGGCVMTRRHMLGRLSVACRQNIPMTNYGLAISYLQGVLERVLELHPHALRAYKEELQRLTSE